MTDTKFTPGPWECSGWGVYASAAEHPDFNQSGAICSIVTGSENSWTDQANAHLIAAAPDLYDALERAEYMLRQYGMRPEFYREVASEARSALAKARGEQ